VLTKEWSKHLPAGGLPSKTAVITDKQTNKKTESVQLKKGRKKENDDKNTIISFGFQQPLIILKVNFSLYVKLKSAKTKEYHG